MNKTNDSNQNFDLDNNLEKNEIKIKNNSEQNRITLSIHESYSETNLSGIEINKTNEFFLDQIICFLNKTNEVEQDYVNRIQSMHLECPLPLNLRQFAGNLKQNLNFEAVMLLMRNHLVNYRSFLQQIYDLYLENHNYKQILPIGRNNYLAISQNPDQTSSLSIKNDEIEKRDIIIDKFKSFFLQILEILSKSSSESDSLLIFPNYIILNNFECELSQFDSFCDMFVSYLQTILFDQYNSRLKIISIEKLLAEKENTIQYMIQSTANLETCVSVDIINEINDLKNQINSMKRNITEKEAIINEYLAENEKINNMLNNAENLINKNKKEREDMEKEKNYLLKEFEEYKVYFNDKNFNELIDELKYKILILENENKNFVKKSKKCPFPKCDGMGNSRNTIFKVKYSNHFSLKYCPKFQKIFTCMKKSCQSNLNKKYPIKRKWATTGSYLNSNFKEKLKKALNQIKKNKSDLQNKNSIEQNLVGLKNKLDINIKQNLKLSNKLLEQTEKQKKTEIEKRSILDEFDRYKNLFNLVEDQKKNEKIELEPIEEIFD